MRTGVKWEVTERNVKTQDFDIQIFYVAPIPKKNHITAGRIQRIIPKYERERERERETKLRRCICIVVKTQLIDMVQITYIFY
jgi:hypothetical protein